MALPPAPGRRWAWAWRVAWALVGSLALATMGWAVETDAMPDAGPRMFFDLPAQSLEKGLSAFGGFTGHSVLVDSAMTQGRTAQAVQGEFSAQQALRLLLAGSGLHARYSGRDAFTLVPQPAQGETVVDPTVSASTLPMTPGPAGLAADFAGALQSAITRALCAKQPDSFGRYRAALQLWTGPEGRIRRANLLESSGVSARDGELLAQLRGLAIGRASPPELAQPITVLLSPRADPAGVCRNALASGS